MVYIYALGCVLNGILKMHSMCFDCIWAAARQHRVGRASYSGSQCAWGMHGHRFFDGMFVPLGDENDALHGTKHCPAWPCCHWGSTQLVAS